MRAETIHAYQLHPLARCPLVRGLQGRVPVEESSRYCYPLTITDFATLDFFRRFQQIRPHVVMRAVP